MEIQRKAWGTILVVKNNESSGKRYDGQKSLSISNIRHRYTLDQMYKIFYNLIEATKTVDFEELNKILKNLQNGNS